MTFSDTAPVRRTAVPLSPVQPLGALDPDNRQARGYDPDTEAFRSAWAAAEAQPGLADALRAELDRETARFRAWTDAYRRAGSGGCGHGGGPGPFEAAAPADILVRARRALEAERLREASPLGRLACALAQTEIAAEAMCTALSEVRSAVDRGDGSAARRAEAAVAVADRLGARTRGLLRAASPPAATAPAEQAEQPETFWRLTREICAPPSEAFLSGAAFREG